MGQRAGDVATAEQEPQGAQGTGGDDDVPGAERRYRYRHKAGGLPGDDLVTRAV